MGKKKNVAVEEEVVETPVEELVANEPAIEEPAPVEEEHHNVVIKEVEYKAVNLVKAPEEVKKIVEFYGITGKDLADGNFD